MTEETKTREQEREEIEKHYKLLYPMTVAFFLIAAGIGIGYFLFREGGLVTDANGYIANVYTNVLSVLVTVFVIDRLNRRRDEQREERLLKERLIRDAGSRVNVIAKQAVHEIKKRGWLTGEDGVLQGADLGAADLSTADLYGANLQSTNLNKADLTNVQLDGANLKDATLFKATLTGAKLFDANLTGANLFDAKMDGTDLRMATMVNASLANANLTGAELFGAVLRDAGLGGANLSGANLLDADLSGAKLNVADLTGANLSGVKLDNALLPTGERWEAGIDLTRFTDPTHPDYWPFSERKGFRFHGR